jgi:DNA-binding CsgD family transcriptional regulator/PAS domain-containing protein
MGEARKPREVLSIAPERCAGPPHEPFAAASAHMAQNAIKTMLGTAWNEKMQTSNPPPLPDLVGAIYDCIPDSGQWQDTLDRIRRVWEGEMATLGVIDSANGALRLSVTCGQAEMLEQLLRYGPEDVPFYSAVPKMELEVPQTVDTIYAMQGPDTREKWLSSRAAVEWAIPNRIDDFLWVPVMRQASRVGSLVVMTSKDRRQISAEDIQALALIAPHVRRAVTIGDLFESERRKGEIFRDVVDCLTHPVLIVSADMQIIFANLAAEALLQEKIAIRSLRGQLSFPYGPANKSVSTAVVTGSRDEYALGPSGINVPLALAEKPMVAHVMPLAQRDPSARVAQHAAAAIFIAAPGETPVPAMDAIAALFGLTAAEKRVAVQIAHGRTRQEIALSSGLSDGTIKSQLASIFDKTDTHDQRGLELLMRELTPPVRTH